MLETTSPRLRERGGAHFWAPDKDPAVRIRMHEEAGELGIPFTSGLLLGIGENGDERVDTLLVIRELADRLGHIQEVIVQPFHPKPDTRMRDVPALGDAEVAGWVAMARLVLGSRDERAGAAEPRARGARAAAALGPQRLGRRLAADGRLHQSRGAVADAARARAPHRGGRASAWSSGCPSTPSTCSAGRSSSIRACARPRCALVDSAGWVPARRPHSQVEAA